MGKTEESSSVKMESVSPPRQELTDIPLYPDWATIVVSLFIDFQAWWNKWASSAWPWINSISAKSTQIMCILSAPILFYLHGSSLARVQLDSWGKWAGLSLGCSARVKFEFRSSSFRDFSASWAWNPNKSEFLRCWFSWKLLTIK